MILLFLPLGHMKLKIFINGKMGFERSNYAFGKDAPSPGTPELWDYLSNVFKATMLMLEEMMEEMEINPEEIKKMEYQDEILKILITLA